MCIRDRNNIVSSEGAAKTTRCALLLGAVLNLSLIHILIAALEAIMHQNTAYYQSDFAFDIKMLREAPQRPAGR